jgi:hypothetical protein
MQCGPNNLGRRKRRTLHKERMSASKGDRSKQVRAAKWRHVELVGIRFEKLCEVSKVLVRTWRND